MPSISDLKKSYGIQRTIDSVYTGGKIELLPDGERLLCTDGDKVHLIHTISGEKKTFGTDDDAVSCFASTDDFLITASSSLLLRVYSYSDGSVNAWKAHEAPVLVMDTDPTQTFVATGSADSTVKVWDFRKGYCTHNFKGHAGIITALSFHPDPSLLHLISGSLDSRIKVWDLKSKSERFSLDGHVSAVRGLGVSKDGQVLVSGGRDKVLIAWDLSNGELINTVPVFESIEDVKVIDSESSDLAVCAGGESGVIKLWDMNSGSCVTQTKHDIPINYSITSLLYAQSTEEVVAVTSDQNLLFYSLEDNFKPTRQIAGYNEEIIETCFVGEKDEKLAVATNTEHIRIYELGSAFCDILYGHSDMIMSLNKSMDGKFLISGSKDNSAIIWRLDPTTSKFKSVGKCLGHTETVSATAFSYRNPMFVITASHDNTLKLWDLQFNDNGEIQIKARYTIKAHSKDIQSVAVAPNDRIYASAALDKTAKIWSAIDGTLLGTLNGHRRGIWCVRFSPSDQIVATSSTDKTIKLWSLKDFSCIRTFEGHLNSVLHVEFLTGGLQLASSGSDGLVKIWTIKENECVTTLDNHEDKIWGLCATNDESLLVSGSADSKITIWKDTTAEEKEEEMKELQNKLMKEQDLEFYLSKKDYTNAIHLALTLKHPMRLLKILSSLSQKREDKDSILGLHSVDKIFRELNDEQMEKLLLFVRDWNTKATFAPIAQSILNLVFKSFEPSRLMQLPNAKSLFEALSVYTERHFDHSKELIKQSYLLDYTLASMDK